MKKVLIYLTAIAMLTACSSDFEHTKPDNYNEIQFSVGSINMSTNKAATRAGEHNHIAWNDTYHANTLGVFAYGNGLIDNEHKIFGNQKVTYADEKWSYENPKYWPDFTHFSSFDFFGYMVEDADPLPDANLSKDGNNYTLSFPASFTSPILTSADNTPLICHAPIQGIIGETVSFQMDQTLTGYDIQFQLGDKMDALRYFVIKSVKIYGENLPVGGTVSRTYTLTAGNWSTTQNPVTWTNLSTRTIASDAPFVVAASWASSASVVKRTVNNGNVLKWGGSGLTNDVFYAIPHASFTPTIEVIYDVYTDKDGNGDGNFTLDRENVKSTIILNKTNFSNLTLGTTGEIQHINIKIVPDYLYVLSDDDQTTGFLIVDNN